VVKILVNRVAVKYTSLNSCKIVFYVNQFHNQTFVTGN